MPKTNTTSLLNISVNNQLISIIFDKQNPEEIMHIRSANFSTHVKSVITLPCRTQRTTFSACGVLSVKCEWQKCFTD